jgi:hypothetical protein
MRGYPEYPQGQPGRQFDDFEASSLFCPTCRQAQPVRRRLLLVLPGGDLYDYSCQVCGTSVGSQTNTTPPPEIQVIPD